MAKKHHSEDWLREQYYENKLSLTQMAEKCGVTQSGILYQMDKHGIERRDRGKANQVRRHPDGKPYHDKEWLKREYVEKERSTLDIADECGVSSDTINKYLHKHGIPVRDMSEATKISEDTGASSGRDHPRWVEYCTYTWHQGYESWHTDVEGTKHQVMVHRLIAVSEFGFEAVKDKLVHHKNGFPLDNRPENLELTTKSEHTKIHHRRGDIPKVTDC